MADENEDIREEQTDKSSKPAHTSGTPRGEDVGEDFQEDHPGDERSDAAGGDREGVDSVGAD